MDKTKWKQIFGKKWMFPAVYMIAAALILALMWWYQDPNEYPLTQDELGLEQVTPAPIVSEKPLTAEELARKLGETVTVSKSIEQMQWPVANPNDVHVSLEFFDEKASDKDMEKALVSFQNELYPHTGIDIVANNNEKFNVVAAFRGEVLRAEKDPVAGYIVEIQHENGISTIYSSLEDVQVKAGEQIKQGEVIGTASRNIFEKDQGNHLHFEVLKDKMAVNPYAFIDQDFNQAAEQLKMQQ